MDDDKTSKPPMPITNQLEELMNKFRNSLEFNTQENNSNKDEIKPKTPPKGFSR
jgi:hypothetical protein